MFSTFGYLLGREISNPAHSNTGMIWIPTPSHATNFMMNDLIPTQFVVQKFKDRIIIFDDDQTQIENKVFKSIVGCCIFLVCPNNFAED